MDFKTYMKIMTTKKLNLRSFMKVIVITICLTGAMNIVAQNNKLFPPPKNFQAITNYILLGDDGMCEGRFVSGPYYCTYSVWEEPNLSETESQLIAYKLYYYPSEQELEEIPFSEGIMITQTVNLGHEGGGALLGYSWVTALYSNPDGESAPSNTVCYFDLPVGVAKHEIKSHSIIYNNQIKSIKIIGIEDIASIHVVDIFGRLITSSKTNNLDIKHLNDGVYIIQITTSTNEMISEKLLIQ